MSHEQPTGVDEAPRLVTVRTLVLSVLAASVVSIGVAVALSFALVGEPEPGPPGPAGAAGQRGATGERGPQGRSGSSAEVDEESVWSAIEGDPQRATEVVQDNLDPAPADVASELEDLRSDVESLCSELSLADALSDEFLTCP